MKHLLTINEFINESYNTVIRGDSPGMDNVNVSASPYGVDLKQRGNTISLSDSMFDQLFSGKSGIIKGDGPGFDDVKVEHGPYGVDLRQGKNRISMSSSMMDKLPA